MKCNNSLTFQALQKLSKGLSRVKYTCTSLSSTYHKL